MKPTPRPFSFDQMYEEGEGDVLDFNDPDYRDLGASEVDQYQDDEDDE